MSSPTQLLLMDCPILRDSDAPRTGMSGFYYALGNFGGSWPGGVLLRSTDFYSFSQIAASSAQVTWGITTNALGAIPNPWVWDTENDLVVNLMHSGSTPLASMSDENVLNGGNVGALICANGDVELIQWGSVSIQGNIATLSRLLRGVRGTDYAVASHAIGDKFVALDGAQSRLIWSIGEIGLRRWYRAGTSGLSLGQIQAYASQAADLKPYAPVLVNGVFDASDNLIITWRRQTRIGGDQDWNDGVADVPLSEATEAYEVDILDGETVVRTLRNITLPTVLYPRALQVEDFGITVPETITVVVYQLSATVGRGFGRRATVPMAWPLPVAANYVSPSEGSLTLDASTSSVFRVVLNGSVSSMTITNPSDHQRIAITWVQDAIGGYTVTMADNMSGARAPRLGMDAVSTQSFLYDAATDTWYAEDNQSAADYRRIETTLPLTGGGDLSEDRTLGINTFTGDTGTGGAAGAVPAPAAGDAVAHKVLGAAGGWEVQGIGTVGVVGVTIDGGGTSPQTGSKGFVRVPYGATITGWTLMADQSGSAQITVKKCAYGSFPTTSSIVDSLPPNLTGQQANSSTTLTNWTTTITAGDVLEFELDSVTTCQRLTLELQLSRT